MIYDLKNGIKAIPMRLPLLGGVRGGLTPDSSLLKIPLDICSKHL
ncbi:MAG: hypothetical protein QNJ68_09075 [Microcoleaceae cyanobacterium MO_207.B10]|nr:hypothetical protein [Microcoleaceae cyanobacterium MO_207.B10]